MRLLLDTHVLLWTIAEETKLSTRADEVMRSEENELVVSAASLWEIAIKVNTGKLKLPATSEYFDNYLTRIGVKRVISISVAHTYATLQLPPVHKDPFDRMLAAQCIVEKMTLVTSDKVFRKYPIEVIW
jgi:PIN domain nuclease of toxin-antitoxin system